MIKDFGNQKLPRFKAGEALLEQVTAERLNDMCSMIEACRLQNGVGYMLNRASSGTTFSILSSESSRPPKLWKVSLSDVDLDPATIIAKIIDMLISEVLPIISNPSQFVGIFLGFLEQIISAITTGNAGSASGVQGMIEAIFQPIYAIIDSVDAKLEAMLGKIDPIRETLESYFTSRGKHPRSGDMIYTDELGICYVIFKEVDDEDGVYPTPNLIFRVPFKVGTQQSGEDTRNTYYALTTFPVPDIAECIKTICKALIEFISKLFGSAFEGIVQSIMDAVAQALYALYELLYELIELILEMIEQIFELINEIWEAISKTLKDIEGLKKDLNDFKDLIGDEFEELYGELAEIWEEFSDVYDFIDGFEDAISVIEDLIANAPILSVISSSGEVHTIKVLADVAGMDLRKNVTWIDSDSGMGHRGKTLLWDEAYPNVRDVDWRELEYVGADGNSYKNNMLMFVRETSFPTYKIEPTEVQVCENHSSQTKLFLEKK